MDSLRRLILLIVLMFLAEEAQATCTGSGLAWTADPDQPSVQTCVNSVASGGTVTLNGGSSTWTQRVTVPSIPMTIIGQTCTLDSNGRPTFCPTQITDATDYGVSATKGLFVWTTTASGLHRISNLSINGGLDTGTPGDSPVGMFMISGNTASWRFDHNIVITARAVGIQFTGYVRGVNDHNHFTDTDTHFPHYVFHDAWNNNTNGCTGTVTNGCGDASWADASNFGTSQFLFFEDNLYDTGVTLPAAAGRANSAATDLFVGARTVHRFNIYQNLSLLDHGTDSTNRSRGHRASEVYRNLFQETGNCPVCTQFYSAPNMLGTRGGTWRVAQNYFNASLGGDINPGGMSMIYYRYLCSEDAFGTGCSNVWWKAKPMTTNFTSVGTTATGTVTSDSNTWLSIAPNATVRVTNAGAFNGTYTPVTSTGATTFTFTFAGCGGCFVNGGTISSAWDAGDTGYPDLDMPGRGGGTLVGAGPTPSASWPSEVLDPIYVVGIRQSRAFPGTTTPVWVSVNIQSTPPIQQNRDVYDECSTASSCTFDGTQGIGYGLRAARPLTCTTGVGYWATDGGGNWNTSTIETMSAQLQLGLSSGADGGLDLCVAGAWVNDAYVPFTYPHPLVTGGGTNVPPGPPTNFSISRVKRTRR